MKIPWKVVICGFTGNVLEAYDFLLFGIFATTITKVFIPEGQTLLMTLAIFASGFIMRPLGGAVIGSIGDKLGRKKALYISAGLMSLSTVMMGILPGYEQWGLFSTVLLVLCRLLQGFSVGGEYSGASIFVIEHTAKDHANFAGSLIAMSSFFGAFLAMGVAYYVTQPFMPAWGWRVAFGLGIIMGILSLYIRLKLLDTPKYIAFLKGKNNKPSPLGDMVKNYLPHMLSTLGIGGLCGILGYTVFTYLNIYFKTVLHVPNALALEYNALCLGAFLLGLPFMGWLADRITPLKVMQCGVTISLFLSYPFYKVLGCTEPLYVMGALILFSLSASAYIAPANGLITHLFPVPVRYRGFSIAYNLGMTLFGGTAPMINTYLVTKTGESVSPAALLIGCSILGLLALLKAGRLDGKNDSTIHKKF